MNFDLIATSTKRGDVAFGIETEFGLVGFYGILTIVGYLMSNPLYIYIYIYDLSTHFVHNILK